MKKASYFFAALVLLFSLMNVSVFAAADPIVMDFSTDPDAFQGISADGDWKYVNDGGKRVFYEECIVGADPDDPANGNGDVYGTVLFDPPIDAGTYKWLKISLKNDSTFTKFEFHYGGDKHGIAAEACTHFDISANDTDYKTYVINIPDTTVATYPVHPDMTIPAAPFWEGNISDFRLDFAYDTEPGGRAYEGMKMYVEYIAFFDSKEAADAWTFTPAGGPVEEATEAPATEAPAAAATEAPAATTADNSAATEDNAATTQAASDDSSDGINGVIIYIIAAAVIIAVVVIIVVVRSSGKKKK